MSVETIPAVTVTKTIPAVTVTKTIPAVTVTGCRVDCPNTRRYQPNKDGETLGCIYGYGTLPEEGFAFWCPLEDKGQQ